MLYQVYFTFPRRKETHVAGIFESMAIALPVFEALLHMYRNEKCLLAGIKPIKRKEN